MSARRAHAWVWLARIVALAAVALVLAPMPGFARSLEDKEKAALAQTVSDFDEAMRNNNFERIVQTIPPKVLSHIAGKAGVSADEVSKAMVSLMAQMLAETKIESFGMDLAAAEYKEQSDGVPYALIPTTTVLSAEAVGRVKSQSHTLGLLDDGKWYLVRVSDAAQVAIVREVYPGFATTDFPAGSMETIKP